MSLGPSRRGMFTFTGGFPDAGSTLTRKFVQPASVTTAAAIGATAQITDASGSGSPAIPQSQEHFTPTQPMPSFSQESTVPETQDLPEQQNGKRQRVNDKEQEQSQPFDQSQDHRDMVQHFVEQLGTPPAAATDALTIRSAHTKFLDLRRQIAAIKEKMDNQVNPHGWKIIPAPLGVANAALEQLIIDEQNLAAQKCLQHIKDAKETDAQSAYNERGAATTVN